MLHSGSSGSMLPKKKLNLGDHRKLVMTLIHVVWESARCSMHNMTADFRMTEITCRSAQTRQSTDSTKGQHAE